MVHFPSLQEGPLEARVVRVPVLVLVLVLLPSTRTLKCVAELLINPHAQLAFSFRKLVSFNLSPTCNLNIIRVFTVLNQMRKIDAGWS